ncbi:MAG: hypothetical protein Q9166_003466 [cf. Caloplaca sp. 2 TL-2023]
MSSRVPEGFVPVSSLSSYISKEVNLMGVVTDLLPAAKSRGSDWTCNLRLSDHTTYDEGVKIRFFRPMEIELPQIQANGDVIILQNIKISSWSGMTMGLSSRNTFWTVLPAASMPEETPIGKIKLKCTRGNGSSAPTQEQMRYAIEICNSRDRSTYGSSAVEANPSSTNPPESSARTSSVATTPSSVVRRDKFALIKDVQIEKFYDLVGQVVKIYPSNGVVELYVTDYTSNVGLFNYVWGDGDDEHSAMPKWRGPLGKMTLTVSLFSPHSYFAQSNVEEDQYVHLRNTRIKWSKDGKLEGSLHTDRYNPDRVDVTIIKDHSDDRVKDLLHRKLEYTKRFSQEKDGFEEMARGQKRKQNEEPKLSKTQLRKRKRKEREQEALEKKQEPVPSDDEGNKENADPYRVRITPAEPGYHLTNYATPSNSPPSSDPPKRRTALNKNVRASYPEYPIRSLSSILSLSIHTTPMGIPYTLPFQNIKSRANVRVVNFFPPDIADFAVKRKKQSEYDILSDYEGDSESEDDAEGTVLPPDTDEEDKDNEDSNAQSANEDDDQEKSKWEWRFGLTLEDASAPSLSSENERMGLYVAGADAECLLKLDACNLRRKPQRLAELRERLFLLWGDLEEKKTAAANSNEVCNGVKSAKSMPFTCCVKQYGIRKRWEKPGLSDAERNWGWDRMFRIFGTTIL